MTITNVRISAKVRATGTGGIAVFRFCNVPNHGYWTHTYSDVAICPYGGYAVEEQTYVTVYVDFPDREGYITDQQTADKWAKFLLDKSQAETFGGRVVVPHDARVELYDRIAVFDTRGT